MATRSSRSDEPAPAPAPATPFAVGAPNPPPAAPPAEPPAQKVTTRRVAAVRLRGPGALHYKGVYFPAGHVIRIPRDWTAADVAALTSPFELIAE